MRGATASPAAAGDAGAAGDARRSWHAASPADALDGLGATAQGLSEEEAAERLARWGPNRLSVEPPVPAWRILIAQGKSLIAALLFAAGLGALLIGDTLEAVTVLLVLLVNVALGFFTELAARRAMEGLKKLHVASATVRRAGRERRIDAARLVPGDLLVLEAGAAVPADARLLESADLRAVEAPLTGEPFPVDKAPPAVAVGAPLAERSSMVYQGTLVADGHGLAVVTATGGATEVGTISSLVQRTAAERTPLERRLDALGRRLVWLTLGLAGLVSLLGLLRGGQPWLMVETGLALAIAAVPEGLPVVATITLAIGMRRMARRRALIRRLPAVETLGSATVVCTDKTGTLTAGEMTVVRLVLAGHTIEVTGAGYAAEGDFCRAGTVVAPDEVPGLRELLETAVLANRATWSDREGPQGDPTEAALLVAAEKAGLSRAELLAAAPEVAEVPFSSERQLMATFHRRADQPVVAYVKGAPGRLVALAGRRRIDGGEEALGDAAKEALLQANRALAAEGLRVLAFARRTLRGGEAPGEDALADLTFLGLVGISDPPAAGVEETVAQLRAAGIRTVMLTGDQRVTAEAVARQLGVLAEDGQVVEGRELIGLPPEQLAARAATTQAFSRVSPAHKLEIVGAYQAAGEIVAMLGDGVNDAPALKKADIGVAMGGRGTDVAKDAASVVLADDRFPTIAAAVEEGRVIFDNVRKFIFYLFSCNLAEVAVLLASVAAGLPLPLLPLQILWLNLVTDVFPALALGMEPAEPDVMRRPPRDPQSEILSRGFLLQITAHGLTLTAVTLAAFLWLHGPAAVEIERARTVAFMTLALAQLLHVFNARSPRPVLFERRLFTNRWLWGALALTTGLQLAVVYQPLLSRLFRTVPLSAADWLLVLCAAATPLLLGQLVRWLAARNAGPDHTVKPAPAGAEPPP